MAYTAGNMVQRNRDQMKKCPNYFTCYMIIPRFSRILNFVKLKKNI